MGTESALGSYPAAGQYRVLVFLTAAGDLTVVVVRRVWNGKDAMDSRLWRRHRRLREGSAEGQSVSRMLGAAFTLLSEMPDEL